MNQPAGDGGRLEQSRAGARKGDFGARARHRGSFFLALKRILNSTCLSSLGKSVIAVNSTLTECLAYISEYNKCSGVHLLIMVTGDFL